MVTLKEYLRKRAESQARYYQRNKEKLLGSRKEYIKAYYEKNKERLLKLRKERYDNDPVTTSNRSRKYHRANKEKNNSKSYQYYLKNKEKLKENHKNWYQKNKEKVAEYARNYRKRIKNRKQYAKKYLTTSKEVISKRASDWALVKKYNITPEQYEQMWSDQKGVCKICGKPETKLHSVSKKVQRLSTDHCHVTSKVRGLLCSKCNVLLGCCDDNINILEACIDYLKKHNVTNGGTNDVQELLPRCDDNSSNGQ